jgi:hypothetical protein
MIPPGRLMLQEYVIAIIIVCDEYLKINIKMLKVRYFYFSFTFPPFKSIGM